MNDRTRNLWLPGMTMLITASVFISLFLRLVPPASWVQPNAPAVLGGTWLLSYCLFGALGAFWSRRAGGSGSVRFLAGIFPAALHLAIFLCVVLAANLQQTTRTPEYLHFNFQLKAFVLFVLLPGIALGLGALPFLRTRANESAPSRA